MRKFDELKEELSKEFKSYTGIATGDETSDPIDMQQGFKFHLKKNKSYPHISLTKTTSVGYFQVFLEYSKLKGK